MKVKVKEEGRKGIYIVNQESIIDFIFESDQEFIHCYIGTPPMLIGADWNKDGVMDNIKSSDLIGLVFGESLSGNMGHKLAVIKKGKRHLFDLHIEESDLEIIK